MKSQSGKAIRATAVTLACTFGWISSGIAAERTPTEVADLYIKVMVNHDPSAVEQLNAHLRPVRQRLGQEGDYADADKLKKADAEFAADVAEMIMEIVPIRLQDKLRPAIVDLMATEHAVQLKTDCKALSATPIRDEGELESTVVSFECQVVKVPETWAQAFQRLAKQRHSEADYLARIGQVKATYLETAPQTVKGELLLARSKKDGIWRNDFAREAFSDIL